MNGKAMIVAMSREICVKLYDAIVAIRLNGTVKTLNKGRSKSS
jgi:type I restriction enzyme R subunit